MHADESWFREESRLPFRVGVILRVKLLKWIATVVVFVVSD